MALFVRGLIFLLCFILLAAADQRRHWVFFSDKGSAEKYSFGKQKAMVEQKLPAQVIDRRRIRGIDPFSKSVIYADLSLEETYIETLRQMGFRVHATSRWLNAVSGYASDTLLRRIAVLPFVEKVTPVKKWIIDKKTAPEPSLIQFPKPFLSDNLQDIGYGLSTFQIEFHNIHLLHQKGLTGEGVIIALMDTGYRLANPALQHIQSRLIAEYDFIQQDSVTSNQPGDVSSQDNHGTLVLSVLAGYLPDTLIGPAYNASFLLAKTEIYNQEIHAEEDNWAMAAEWAEQLGADIVSTSLGYSTFDPGQESYTYQDMDGETTIITRAANELGIRGVLVVTSAGNEGSSPWYYITAPADGPYALAVGSVNSRNNVSLFSSRGPTADDRIKPDVVALGEGVYGASTGSSFYPAGGTSLSCPLAAGVAALLIEQNPYLNVDDLLYVLRTSGDSAAAPNNDRGWGKIDALRAWELSQGFGPDSPLSVHAYPNPYGHNMGIVYFPVSLPSGTDEIHLEIFNILGQKVKDSFQQGLEGMNLVRWDGRNQHGNPVAAGIYIYRISTPSGKRVGKLTVLY
ncbi:MAG: T9SS C-terminal target domain-containing protein [Calditrichaeota bacterium]|nr:S8 family peptidase [Calditrichota bacterium]RQV92979.1 MAG: T9SS C-terminal target domain-containing protein [bacterium]RQW08061.1 MAG: T9SS C-terminal target domain-containing protein [Calditrichota bacterium]